MKLEAHSNRPKEHDADKFPQLFVGKTDWVPEKKNNSQDNWNQKRYRIA
jgi:hypothetical protein